MAANTEQKATNFLKLQTSCVFAALLLQHFGVLNPPNALPRHHWEGVLNGLALILETLHAIAAICQVALAKFRTMQQLP